MNHEIELKIQAHLDGNLSVDDSREVEELICREAEARALHDALAATKALLHGNEPEFALPESRDFYFSKIRREIEREPASGKSWGSFSLSWRNWWVRLGTSVAALALVGTLTVFNARLKTFVLGSSGAREIESPLDEFSTISFHSESANMTVVWVQARIDTN